MWKRLHDNSLFWEDKLKVACYIWRGMDQSRDQGKAGYLYQWTSESLVTIYRKSTERYTYMYVSVNDSIIYVFSYIGNMVYIIGSLDYVSYLTPLQE